MCSVHSKFQSRPLPGPPSLRGTVRKPINGRHGHSRGHGHGHGWFGLRHLRDILRTSGERTRRGYAKSRVAPAQRDLTRIYTAERSVRVFITLF